MGQRVTGAASIQVSSVLGDYGSGADDLCDQTRPFSGPLE
jgi:hypothetical protein